MTLTNRLKDLGLTELQEVPMDSRFQSFESVKEALNGNVQALPSIRVPVTVSIEIDAEPQTYTLVVPSGKFNVVRSSRSNIKDGAVKIGPFYLEVEAHHSIKPVDGLA